MTRTALLAVTSLATWASLACSKPARPPTPARPDETATVEVTTRGLLVQGTLLDEPDAGHWYWQSERHRRAIQQALDRDAEKIPLMAVAPDVPFDQFYGAFTVVARECAERHGLSFGADRPEDYAGGPPVRLACLGSARTWQLRGPTYFVGAVAGDAPPVFMVTVAVDTKGFYVASANHNPNPVKEEVSVYSPGPAAAPDRKPSAPIEEAPPTIPRIGSSLNFAALAVNLAGIKAAHPTTNALILVAGADVTAEDFCKTLEFVTPYFPDIVAGAF
jgi:hypothetical protein